MKAKHLLKEFYDASEDEVTKHKKTDSRKVRLTLKHLNKLRRRRELSKLENAERMNNLSSIYKPSQ